MKYYLIAGEASGDLHASRLMQSIASEDPGACFRFFGGDLMAAVGGTRVRHYREMAYMGFGPVLLHLPAILANMRLCKRDIVQWAPDVVILIDYPGFNLDIAKFVKANTSIPVYYYISPKIWAWKEYRIKSIKRDVDEMFCILPFETDFYRYTMWATPRWRRWPASAVPTAAASLTTASLWWPCWQGRAARRLKTTSRPWWKPQRPSPATFPCWPVRRA